MTGRMALILGAISLASGPAWGQEAGTAPGSASGPPAELKALADSCTDHKFETIVAADGAGRGKRVKICGKPGQTGAEWLVTLKDSARKVEADPAMSQGVKDQIIAALKVEIARMEIVAKPAPSTAPVATLAIPKEPVSVPEAAPQYSSVPPLPAPLPRASAATASASKSAVVRPRLTIRCGLPRENFAECARFERETQILIRADEDLADGTSLRFLRGGDQRAELDLGTLRKGESLREKLPGRVCSGVMRGRVQVQVLSKNQVAETLGPFALHCGS